MRRRSLWFVLLALVGVAAQAPLGATTLLTSGVPVTFGLPDAPNGPRFFNGDIGYAIYVPPGAQRLTVRYVPLTPSQVMEVYVRYGADVGFSGVGTIFRDYVLTNCGSAPETLLDCQGAGVGTQQIIIHPQSSPPLRAGLYYIAFNLVSSLTLTDCQILAIVEGGSTAPTHPVAVSSFDRDPDGWTLGGGTDADLLWYGVGGNPGGFLRYEQRSGGSLAGRLVAPAKFLGNLAALKGPRLEFDFKQLAGPVVQFPVELRITGAGTTFSWLGSPPAVPPDQLDYPPPAAYPPFIGPPPNPPVSSPPSRWWHYVAPLQGSLWYRLSGDAPFSRVLAGVQSLEVITDLSSGGEAQALDNFALVAEGDGPPQVVLIGNTSFAGGADGWDRNYPASELAGATTGNKDSNFRWVGFEGNPGGFIRVNNSGGANRDYVVAPERFLGDYRQIPNAQIEFDYYHSSARGATLPVELRLIGANSVFVWTGAVPGSIWTHYAAPLNESYWRRAARAAAFAEALANVRRLEISADQAEGPEWNGIDNFWVLTAATTPAPPALSANPQSLTFTGLVRGQNPVAQSVGVTSMGGGSNVSFTASSSAAWLKISAASGTTPRSLQITPDLTGLAAGAYTGRIVVTPLDPTLGPREVTVTLNVNAQPNGIPRISRGGVVNAANRRTQLSPGALGTVYGDNFTASGPVQASFLPNSTVLPTKVQGVRVLVQETYGALIAEAPLLYVSRNQINFQLPYECFGRAEVLIVVDSNGVLSDPQAVQVISSAPGIFTWGDNDRAVAVNEDGSVNTSDRAAPRGSTLTVYLTGQGVITPALASGAAATARPLVRCPLPAQAWVGGARAQLLFVGMAPGLVGVAQINLSVPFDAPVGETQLLFNIDGWTSNFAGVTIR